MTPGTWRTKRRRRRRRRSGRRPTAAPSPRASAPRLLRTRYEESRSPRAGRAPSGGRRSRVVPLSSGAERPGGALDPGPRTRSCRTRRTSTSTGRGSSPAGAPPPVGGPHRVRPTSGPGLQSHMLLMDSDHQVSCAGCCVLLLLLLCSQAAAPCSPSRSGPSSPWWPACRTRTRPELRP